MNKIKLFLLKIFKIFADFFKNTGLYKIIPYRTKIYDFLFQYIWPHGDILEIQGSKMYIGVRDKDTKMRKTFQSYAISRVHEEATTELFKKVVKERDVVIDLGANIGYFTLLAARLAGPKGRVYAFEPEPKNYNYLLKNIKLNNYKNIIAIQKAVSDKREKNKLFICPYESGHHTIKQHEGIDAYRTDASNKRKEFIEIETITLDDFFENKKEPIDVIKMDIEGAEMLALLGMNRILKSNQNIKMFVEFFPLLIEKMGNSPREFIRKLLEDYKLSIFIIPDDYDASKGEMIKINSVNEIMNLCKDEKNHINLFLEKL